MVPVLEAVPNFSAGRDQALFGRLVQAVTEAGAEVLDASRDPDHNRAVLTYIGAPDVVEEASVAAARVAVEGIDLRDHLGVHPRVGALDVLPFVPLVGLTMGDARNSARRVGERLTAELGVPVYFYAEASDPPGMGLAELRRGGYEALVDGFPTGRRPDLLPAGWSHPGVHPSAGAICVGARPLLLAWNVEVEGLSPEQLEAVAAELREANDGYEGVRALGLVLAGQGRMQISMNLEHVRNRRPFHVFRALERRVVEEGGRLVGTEVIGLIPDRLVFEAAAERLALLDPDPLRVLSSRLIEHLGERASREAEALLDAVRASGDATPASVRNAAERLGKALTGSELRNETQ